MTKIKKVVVLYKLSVHELSCKFGTPDTSEPVMKAHKENENSKQIILKQLTDKGIEVVSLARASEGIPECDLVIAAGGDGTFLEASHHLVGPTPILGVNTCPSSSYGHWCFTEPASFAYVLDLIENCQIKPFNLLRLQLAIGPNLIKERVLNEVFIAHECPAGTTKYELTQANLCRKPNGVFGLSTVFSEDHISSGLVIGTAAGSTGTMRSMGMYPMSVNEDAWQFCSNLPYQQPEFPLYFTKGKLRPNDRLFVESKTRKMKLWIDGSHVEYDLPMGKVLSVRPEYSLNVFINENANEKFKSKVAVNASL